MKNGLVWDGGIHLLPLAFTLPTSPYISPSRCNCTSYGLIFWFLLYHLMLVRHQGSTFNLSSFHILSTGNFTLKRPHLISGLIPKSASPAPTSCLSTFPISHCLEMTSAKISFQYPRLYMLESKHSQRHKTKCVFLIILPTLIGDMLQITLGLKTEHCVISLLPTHLF